mgnify:CR=1 FL=1
MNIGIEMWEFMKASIKQKEGLKPFFKYSLEMHIITLSWLDFSSGNKAYNS